MSKAQYPKLLSVKALDNYMLELKFSNNEKRIYDFKPNLAHLYYKELQNPALFKNVTVEDGEIIWVTGQDFCPHTLYDKSIMLRANHL